ncbi:PDDEXK nuclease domain-containing protein [Gordonibacter massiliensis (ex Traore et al. 2017)]|uniref:PDDEXK nuclease domain-containing protein n=1 Tax=Gordonibacter massiliensis (ex Traore et al. 2017) TaxID=1841863 RepID=UPI001C8B8880|nr:PDDEXK nuclease domain-containing protein [Gordonibacter massiliensis (ex Traore et al. 2017)]MBX9035319.1 DUF1016 domain-containing protein [Gordonibacter massiliensis (ex Traore et al. 2017)]
MAESNEPERYNDGRHDKGSYGLVDAAFYAQIHEIMSNARGRACSAANFAMVQAYWHIGESIVAKQKGLERAEYGSKLIQQLSKRMTTDFGKGFTVANLKNMRQFYVTFPKSYALRSELSWTHYRMLMRVSQGEARSFYLKECAQGNWSTRELERQIESRAYERLIGKPAFASDSEEDFAPKRPEDVIRDPYVLEFLSLKQDESWHESNIEQALIDHLEDFMLELGRGFAFVGRQKRITLDGDHFYIDLVFYNYVARCFVLIDLKTGKLTHQDIGQMQMYVNYYTRELMNEGDNPPVGLVMCADKKDAVVKYTLPEGERQIYVSKCLPNLPSEDELRIEIKRQYDALENAAGHPLDDKEADGDPGSSRDS